MLEALWQIFLGSILFLAIVLLWIAITSLIVVAIKQWKRDHHA